MTALILIYPPAMFKDPKIIATMQEHNIQSPISIEHSLIECARCHQQGWIGPKQREAAENGFGEIVCFTCLIDDPAGPYGTITLNPDIDRVQRRVVTSSTTCPACQRTSYHPRDIAERYCGACHRFHADMIGVDQPEE